MRRAFLHNGRYVLGFQHHASTTRPRLWRYHRVNITPLCKPPPVIITPAPQGEHRPALFLPGIYVGCRVFLRLQIRSTPSIYHRGPVASRPRTTLLNSRYHFATALFALPVRGFLLHVSRQGLQFALSLRGRVYCISLQVLP